MCVVNMTTCCGCRGDVVAMTPGSTKEAGVVDAGDTGTVRGGGSADQALLLYITACHTVCLLYTCIYCIYYTYDILYYTLHMTYCTILYI